MPMSPQQIAKKWADGVSGGVENYRSGVQAVTEAPTEAAIAAIPRYMTGVQEAVNSGKMERALRRVTLDDWKRMALDKGANRLAQGARSAEPKFASFMSEFMPFVEQVVRGLPPRGTLEDNITRMVQNARQLATFERRS